MIIIIQYFCVSPENLIGIRQKNLYHLPEKLSSRVGRFTPDVRDSVRKIFHEFVSRSKEREE